MTPRARPRFRLASVAEAFLHHGVLILPVVDEAKVVGVITRGDFFRPLVERFEIFT